jgi:protein phosphatase
VRQENQDAIFPAREIKTGDMDSYEAADFNEYPFCIAVIDGMGGYEGGALAARAVAEEFAKAVSNRRFDRRFGLEADEAALRGIIILATNRMAEEAGKKPELREMGATFAGLIVREATAVAFNCGDCRAYRISHGEIERLTKDHSVVQVLFESGEIDEDGMRSHPRKNIVTSAVTANLMETPELYVRGISRVDADEYFICSDGVWEALPVETLLEMLRGPHPESAQKIRDALIEAQCRDNVSFIWAKS